MVPSLKLSFITNDNNPTNVGLALGSTIHFGGLEFIAYCFEHPSLSPQGWYLGAVFMGMVQSGSPSLLTPLKESSGEDDTTSDAGGSMGSLGPEDATW
jgi:hypothetical protein